MAKDLTGMQFGFLFVKKQGEPVKSKRTWVVQCSCGSPEKSVDEGNLLSGRTKSCGCAANRLRKASLGRRYNLVNQRFGRLWVLWRAGSKVRKDGKGTRSLWECRCDCGKNVIVAGDSLRLGHTKSCGCLQIDSRMGVPGEAGFNALFLKYKSHAEKRGLAWELSEEDFRGLVLSNCHYCGEPPKQISVASSVNGKFVYNGIDRRNNLLGYVSGNVVSCCGIHNRMKGTMSEKEFAEACLKVTEHMNAAQRG